MLKNILVIEDEPSIVENITYALSTEGFEPVWCGTGTEAIEKLESEAFALIIVDIGLPDMNGFALAADIRRDSGVPLIFLTARSGEIDRVAGLELGGDDYVVKPFSPRELSARVRAVLRRSGGHDIRSDAPESISGVPFRIDEEKRRISYHGEPLELTRYEYRILRLLIYNPGRVFTREYLMESAWVEPDMSVDRTVDTHIKTLRQKLKAVSPDDEPIVTHRGVGYSLKEVL